MNPKQLPGTQQIRRQKLAAGWLTWHISRNVCLASTNALEIGGSGSQQSGVSTPSKADVECQTSRSASTASRLVPEPLRTGGGFAGRSGSPSVTTRRSLLILATALDSDCQRHGQRKSSIGQHIVMRNSVHRTPVSNPWLQVGQGRLLHAKPYKKKKSSTSKINSQRYGGLSYS